MPILHVQLGGQAQTPDGKNVLIHPAIALVLRGPILQVTVTIEPNAGIRFSGPRQSTSNSKSWTRINRHRSNGNLHR